MAWKQNKQKWPVTMNLSNCKASGYKKAVIEGESCVAYITADGGYTLSGAEIRILMGGNDVSNYYSDGVVAIPNVTGDITIIVTAIEQAVSYTNQIPLSIEPDSNEIYNGGLGYKQDARLNSSANAVDTDTTHTNRLFVTGLLPIQKGTIFRFKNCWIDPDGTMADYPMSASGCNIYVYTESGRPSTAIGMAWESMNGKYFTATEDSDGNIVALTWAYTGDTDYAYVRFTLAGIGEEAVITINEEID